MKIVEPISSTLLITGSAYAGGVAQNSAFMHFYGVNPVLSQPEIDKIFYDGGLVLFEVFIDHFFALLLLFFILMVAALICMIGLSIRKKHPFKLSALFLVYELPKKIEPVQRFSGFGVFVYLIFLTFSTYQAAQTDGREIAKVFLDTCHAIRILKSAEAIQGCALRKDRDSLWYYTFENNVPKVASVLIVELDHVIYLDPQVN